LDGETCDEPFDSRPAAGGRAGGETLGWQSGEAVFGLLLAFLFGAGLVYAWWSDALRVVGHQVTQWGVVLGIGLVVVMPLAMLMVVWPILDGKRLVIGRDRLQVLKTRNGKAVVVLQIPYSNIADMSYESTSEESYIGINLRSLTDPETYPADKTFQAGEALGNGWHYRIESRYQKPLKAIYEAILAAQHAPVEPRR
jgi:hypothetical protein